MRDLENYSMTEVIDNLVENVMLEHDISRALAKKLVLNALTYNCVANEVYDQVSWLIGEENENE